MENIQDAKKERFHFLDGLRAIASIVIVIHHSLSAGISKFLHAKGLHYLADAESNFTQSGVALFFVLSGVVLLRPYVRGQRKFKTLDYFYRRIKRIYPPYLFALLFGWLVIVFIKSGPHTYYADVWKWHDTGWKELFLQSLILNFRGSTFYNLAWWSLQIEVVFYILVPLFLALFMFSKKINYVQIGLTLAATVVLPVMLQHYLNAHYPKIYSNDKLVLTVYRSIDFPVCFLLGIYLAKFDFEKIVGTIMIVIGLAFILVYNSQYVPLVNTGYGFLYAGIIIHAFKSKKIQHFLDRPMMIWLGERSYSLFLIHFSVFYLVDYLCSMFLPERNILYGVLTRGGGILLAGFAAILLFNFVERRQARGLVTDKIFWPWQIAKLRSGATED